MPGLVPGIHVFLRPKTWMAGTSPAMTWRDYRSMRELDLCDDRHEIVARNVLDRGRAGKPHHQREIVAHVFQHALRAERAAERKPIKHRAAAGHHIGAERQRFEHI